MRPEQWQEYQDRIAIKAQALGAPPISSIDDAAISLAVASYAQRWPMIWAAVEHSLPEGHLDRCTDNDCGLTSAAVMSQAVFVIITTATRPDMPVEEVYEFALMLATELKNTAMAALGPRP